MSKYPIQWEIEALRMTGFFKELFAFDDKLPWWSEATGDKPDESLFKHKEDQFQVIGLFKDGSLKLQVHPIRIDWIYSGIAREDSPSGAFTTIGEFESVLDRFSDLINNWLNNSEIAPLERLAFGAILVSPLSNREEGYTILDQLLPVTLFAENSSDFLYQINRPRPSEVMEGLSLNRLSKWSVAARKGVKIAGGADSVRIMQTADIAYALRLELDLSTSADFKDEFQKKNLIPIFSELIDLGVEISEEGDVK